MKDKPIDRRSWMNPKKYKPKEIHTRTHHKLLRNKDKNIVKAARGKWCRAWRGAMVKWLQISQQKPWSPEASGTAFLKHWRKKTCQPRNLFSEKIFLRNESKKKKKKTWVTKTEFVASVPALKELVKIFRQKGNDRRRDTWNTRAEGRGTEMVNIWVKVIDFSSWVLQNRFDAGNKKL